MIASLLENVSFAGGVNTSDADIRANIAHSIRLGHPQVRPVGPKPDRICLVGGGPSLEMTFHELRDLYFAGAKVVTLNGAYQWCLARNIKPSAQIVLDARPENARFVTPEVPQCRYYLASQCHPDTWAAVQDYAHVGIWHAVGPDPETEALLRAYYRDRVYVVQHGDVAGTTVLIRAIALLRALGYLRFDLFGADSCWLDEAHHAYPQPENDRDRRIKVTIQPTGHPEQARVFWCAPWHLKQLDDFLNMIRAKGDDFVLRVHGPGLLAHALATAAELEITQDDGHA